MLLTFKRERSCFDLVVGELDEDLVRVRDARRCWQRGRVH